MSDPRDLWPSFSIDSDRERVGTNSKEEPRGK